VPSPPLKILLDEFVDCGLADHLSAHDVATVPGMGWAGIKNGELLRLAEREFDIFLTTDRSLPFQQNLSGMKMAVVVLAAKTSRLNHLIAVVPELLQKLSAAEPGQAVVVGS